MPPCARLDADLTDSQQITSQLNAGAGDLTDTADSRCRSAVVIVAQPHEAVEGNAGTWTPLQMHAPRHDFTYLPAPAAAAPDHSHGPAGTARA